MTRILRFIVPLFGLIIPTALLAQPEPIQVVATTTIIADVARNVSGDLADVVALIPPDSDIHAFQPTPQDAVIIAEADVVLVNGGNLEEGLMPLVETTATVPVTSVSEGVPLRVFGAHDDNEADCVPDDHDQTAEETHEAGGHEHAPGGCDPHVWSDPTNVAIWAENIANVLAEADPAHAETYHANAAAYVDQLTALDAELESLFAPLPESRRVLVTNHDFLSYFAARYGFEMVGTVMPGTSTLAEPAPQDVANLIEVIKSREVPAIFAEVSDTQSLATTIAEDTGGVQVVTLYSGSLSAPDGPAATYMEYMRYNAQAIAGALSPEAAS